MWPDSVTEMFVDDEGIVTAIFFQTKEMMDTFRCYPEVILLDATYKLNDRRMPLYVMAVIDGNGETEIVGLWLVENEERKTLAFALDAFKKHNPQWEKVECLMTDKDITEREVIYEKFPGKPLLICLFHTLRSFRREVTTDKLGVAAEASIRPIWRRARSSLR